MVVLVYFTALLALMWRRRGDSGLDNAIKLVAVVLAAQILLGLANVIFHIPLSIAVAHNAMGAGLLLSVIHLIWQHQLLPKTHTATAPNTTTMTQEVTA